MQGSLSFDSVAKKQKEAKKLMAYEDLLAHSDNFLDYQESLGYQDYIDDQMETGDAIDINTREYRYIGYFTTMRKAIELVWSYPLDATRRIHGKVGLSFRILKRWFYIRCKSNGFFRT